MFGDISRHRPRVRPKVAGSAFDLSNRPQRPVIHGHERMLWRWGRSLPHGARLHPIRMALWRGFEVTIALMALVSLCVPLLVIFAVLRHKLIAIPTRDRNGRLFGRLNFAPDGPAVRFLRETGLNRLPELINVLRGDMSLIGPHLRILVSIFPRRRG